MKWNFLYQITAASRTPDKGATANRSPLSLPSVLNWIYWPPPRKKFLGAPLGSGVACAEMYSAKRNPMGQGFSDSVSQGTPVCRVKFDNPQRDLRAKYYNNHKHAVAQLVEALRYKPEGRGFDSRWCHWNFSLKILPAALSHWCRLSL